MINQVDSFLFRILDNLNSIIYILCNRNFEIISYSPSFSRFIHHKDDISGESAKNYIQELNQIEFLKNENQEIIPVIITISPEYRKFRCFGYQIDNNLLIIAEELMENESEVLNQMAHLANDISNMARNLKRRNRTLRKINSRITEEAKHDPLTNLYNRRDMSDLISEYIKYTLSNDLPLTVIMVDIDFFKSVNDTYGHEMGDKVLKDVAQLLTANLRKDDMAIRYGGEEFLLVFPHTDIQDARIIAEKIRTLIETTKIIQDRKITASFGIAQVMTGDTEEILIDRADKCLYQAKEQGRNRVVYSGKIN